KNRLVRTLPENVDYFYLKKPSLRKSYLLSLSKFFLFDNDILRKYRKDQKHFYLTHGCFGLKNTIGKITVPDYVDFVLSPSGNVDNIIVKQFGLTSKEQCLHTGFPCHDIFYSKPKPLVFLSDYDKKIIWAPTFRKGGGDNRNDSTASYPLGIPLLGTLDELAHLNTYLSQRDIVLIVKLHPMQDISDLELKQFSHIKFLTNQDLKRKNTNVYQLLMNSDALLSDYSAISYDYLHLDKPIGYVFSDLNDYKLGLSVDNVDDYIAGDKIMFFNDLLHFIDNIYLEIDKNKEKRKELFNKIFEKQDGESCERLAQIMEL
ncbi:TPA: CDP-glycerol glycerophosphotransferase family protein, partial [Streptococcus pneumoniae]|nr:CDP-glycerol glycerophosphotransferase family protein [Streptococcus pneumoniae]